MTLGRGKLASLLPFLLSASAWAEVMDKVSPPWSSGPLLLTLLACAVTFTVATKGSRAALCLAFVGAAAWAIARVDLDDLYWWTGAQIRSELTQPEVQTWVLLLRAQAALPLLCVGLGWISRRRLEPKRAVPGLPAPD
jgi:hypothetical protein